MVDASEQDSSFFAKVDMKTLPAPLQNKSRAELQKIVKDKALERGNVQKEIAELSVKREAFITDEKTKGTKTKDATLETEVEKIIREQAKRYNMVIL